MDEEEKALALEQYWPKYYDKEPIFRLDDSRLHLIHDFISWFLAEGDSLLADVRSGE